MNDLEGRTASLEPGHTYQLPLLPLDGVVLCPGEMLPHRLLLATDRLAVRLALQALPPVQRLLAVVCCQDVFHRGMGLQLESVGCVAEIIKMSDDGINILAVGRQRFQLVLDGLASDISLQRMRVQILPDWPPPPIPACATAGLTAWPLWVYNQVDAEQVARRARALFADRLPHIACEERDPLSLSYFLITKVPFDNVQRQQLLAQADVVRRLNLEVEWLSRMSNLYCVHCNHELAVVQDCMQLRNAGASSLYVNSHAVIHDVLTLLNVYGADAVGDPERQHSWFPRYAWRIAYCGGCRGHLGWEFSRYGRGVEGEVECFWGLRRAAVTPTPDGPILQYIQPRALGSDADGDSSGYPPDEDPSDHGMNGDSDGLEETGSGGALGGSNDGVGNV